MSQKINEDLIRLKAELLCYGIRENKYSDQFYHLQNPYDIHKGGYVGLHFLLDNILSVLATTTYCFDKFSKYEIAKDNEKFFLIDNKNNKYEITPIIMPKWYQKTTTSQKSMSRVFAHEGLHYIHMQYAGCIYQNLGSGCKFCGTGCQWLQNTPKEIAETAFAAYQENPDYQVCLGGGVKSLSDKGVAFFTECLQLIHQQNNSIPVWVEMIPPDENEDIEKMIQAGASAFGFNLEIWDDKLRKIICPGKSEISKNRYFEAWEYVQKRLGKDKTNTVLITSLEPEESTLAGIEEISQKQVRITLLPFKPWDTSEYSQKKPTSPDIFYNLAYELAKNMKKYKIEPKNNLGCANCGSCTIEEDIMNNLLND